MRAHTMLDKTGHQTIVWTEESDALMEEIIAKKLKEGIVFHIIEPRFFGLLPAKKTQLTDASEAHKYRALSIADEDFKKFVASGSGDVVDTPDEPVRRTRRSRDPKEIASNQSIGHRQAVGG